MQLVFDNNFVSPGLNFIRYTRGGMYTVNTNLVTGTNGNNIFSVATKILCWNKNGKLLFLCSNRIKKSKRTMKLVSPTSTSLVPGE